MFVLLRASKLLVVKICALLFYPKKVVLLRAILCESPCRISCKCSPILKFWFPYLFSGETALDITAVLNDSYILTDIGNVYGFGQCCDQKKRNIVKKFDCLANVETGSLRKIFVGEDYLFGSFIEKKLSLLPLNNFKALEKSFLYKMRQILKKVIEPLCEEKIHSNQFSCQSI